VEVENLQSSLTLTDLDVREHSSKVMVHGAQSKVIKNVRFAGDNVLVINSDHSGEFSHIQTSYSNNVHAIITIGLLANARFY